MVRTVILVEDEAPQRDALAQLLEGAGLRVKQYESGEALLAEVGPELRGCLLLDFRLPGCSGTALQSELKERGVDLPIIFLTAHGDVGTSVRALKAGAYDFLEKPASPEVLLERVLGALALERRHHAARAAQGEAAARVARLTEREREILAEVAAGRSSKETARRLGISHRTVEVHRAHIMQKVEARGTVDLVRLAEACGLLAARTSGARRRRAPAARRRT